MLPEIDGFEVCKRIKQNSSLKNIQIIMLTARKMEDDILEGFESGAIDYITKPFSNKVLLARIKAHLANANINFSNKTLFKEKIDFISDLEIKFVGNEELLSTPEVVKKAEQA